jgi:hypothetical protein
MLNADVLHNGDLSQVFVKVFHPRALRQNWRLGKANIRKHGWQLICGME